MTSDTEDKPVAWRWRHKKIPLGWYVDTEKPPEDKDWTIEPLFTNPSSIRNAALDPGLALRIAEAIYGKFAFEAAFATDKEATDQMLKDIDEGHHDYGDHVSQEEMMRVANRVVSAFGIQS